MSLPFLAILDSVRWGTSVSRVAAIMAFGGSLAASAWAVRAARNFALRRQLLDRPNSRSSHAVATPRLGGVAFVPVILIAGAGALFVPGSPVPLLGTFLVVALLLGILGLCDDLFTLSSEVRFPFHVGAALALIFALNRTLPELLAQASVPAWLAGGLVTLWIVGLLNAYNFMDGIDAIAGVQAVVAGCGWGIIGLIVGAPASGILGFGAAAAVLGFLTLNWPPAKIFMGDSGSTVLGFYFAGLPLLVAVESGRSSEGGLFLVGGALLVWPFVADASFTFLRRLKNGERVFNSHRSHLYQRLAISGQSHRVVAAVYGGLALAGTLCAWALLVKIRGAWQVASLAVSFLFGLLWTWTILSEKSGSRGTRGS